MHETNPHKVWLEHSLRLFKERYGRQYGISSLGYFGSFARGTANEDSDVDIVFDTVSPNLFRAIEMKQDLERLLGKRVDLVQLRGLTNLRLKVRIEREAIFI